MRYMQVHQERLSLYHFLAAFGFSLFAGCGGGGAEEGSSRSGVNITEPISRVNGSAAAAPGDLVVYRVACSGNGKMSYMWDAGDGSLRVSGGSTFEYRYASEGKFLPRVMCTDASGAAVVSTAVAYQQIVVPTHTVTGIAATVSASGATTEVAFSATCVGSRGDSTLQYAWSFGDGASAEGSNPRHTYLNSRPGQYTAVVRCTEVATRSGVTGQVVDASQTVSASTTVLIDAVATKTPRITRPLSVNPYIPTTAAPTVFSMECVATNGGPISYTFDFGDGTPVQVDSSGSVTHSYVPMEGNQRFLVRASCNQGGGMAQMNDRWLSVREPEMSLLAGRVALPFRASRVAVDHSGSVYVVDAENNAILKVDRAGTVSTLAGGTRGFVDGVGVAAHFSLPTGITVDRGGHIYVADSGNAAIRKISPVGEVSTLARLAADPAKGLAAVTLAVDSGGNLYVTDPNNNAILKITPTGDVSTLAGGTVGYADGQGTAAKFAWPADVAIDGDGNLLVADWGNGAIRKVTQAGVVSTLAGGRGTVVRFNQPHGVATDSVGNIYVAEYDESGRGAIRKVTPEGDVTLLAGGVSGSSGGAGGDAQFLRPDSVAVDSDGTVYVAQWDAVMKISSTGVVSTLAGGEVGNANGIGTAAQFRYPAGVAMDRSGNTYVADEGNHTIRKISPNGEVSLLAGGLMGYANGTGAAAQFSSPTGVAVDSQGNVYVADKGNHAVRRINPSGAVSTLAGGAIGTVAEGRFRDPSGVAVDGGGNVYVADTGNKAIRKITPEGVVSVLAGGLPGAEVFNFPQGVAVATDGTVYVADVSNHAVFKVSPTGAVSGLAGGTEGGHADGLGAEAKFFQPSGVAVDSNDNVYVADSDRFTFLVDSGMHRIRKISPAGLVTTIAGAPGAAAFQSGRLPGRVGHLGGIAIYGRHLVFSSENFIAQIDFAP